MLSPFNIFQKPEDVKPYIDNNEKLILPICDNIVFALGKCLDPFEDNFIIYDRNQATVLGAFETDKRLKETRTALRRFWFLLHGIGCVSPKVVGRDVGNCLFECLFLLLWLKIAALAHVHTPAAIFSSVAGAWLHLQDRLRIGCECCLWLFIYFLNSCMFSIQ